MNVTKQEISDPIRFTESRVG